VEEQAYRIARMRFHARALTKVTRGQPLQKAYQQFEFTSLRQAVSTAEKFACSWRQGDTLERRGTSCG